MHKTQKGIIPENHDTRHSHSDGLHLIAHMSWRLLDRSSLSLQCSELGGLTVLAAMRAACKQEPSHTINSPTIAQEHLPFATILVVA